MQAIIILLTGLALFFIVLKWEAISAALGFKRRRMGGKLPHPKYKKCFFCGTIYVVRRNSTSKCPKCSTKKEAKS